MLASSKERSTAIGDSGALADAGVRVLFMLTEAVPLPDNTMIIDFTPDSTLAWCVAYAGPCGDEGCDAAHTRLYLVPMIGWLHAVPPATKQQEEEEVMLRPAIMSSNGIVTDYLSIDSAMKFIAVVRASDTATATAKEIYRQRFGTDNIVTNDSTPIQN
jgi:hypothetical protein